MIQGRARTDLADRAGSLPAAGGGEASTGSAPRADVSHAAGVPEIVIAWRALAASHAAVVAALDRELGERHGLGVSEFEVLERLAEDEEHQFRVQELAESVHLSQSALLRPHVGELRGAGRRRTVPAHEQRP